MGSNKYAVFGLDLEDWYHLDYLKNLKFNKDYSMLDGFQVFLEIIKSNQIESTIFTVGEIAKKVKNDLIFSKKIGCEIACHGMTHTRPLTLTDEKFIHEICVSKKILEDIIQDEVIGFRAPCFSINENLISLLKNYGYKYDSSKINFKGHPLYGHFTLSQFKSIKKYIYIKDKFIEFEIPTCSFINKKIPFSGGGYLRLFPYSLIKYFVKKMEKNSSPIFFYIHPFELSRKSIPKLRLNMKDKFRMHVGRRNLHYKLDKVIKLLKKNNWKIVTFKQYYESITK